MAHDVDRREPGRRSRRLPLADTPQLVGDRRVHFVMVANSIADLVGLHGTKVRITFLPGPERPARRPREGPDVLHRPTRR